MRQLGALVDVAAVAGVGAERVAGGAVAAEGARRVAAAPVAAHHAALATLVDVNTIIISARLEPFITVAGVRPGQVLAGTVATHRPGSGTLVHVAAHVIA